jgi:ABC-2 type transport system permease protein
MTTTDELIEVSGTTQPIDGETGNETGAEVNAETNSETDAELDERAVARRALRELVRMEARLAWREPAGPIFGIGLPVLLLVIFGNISSFRQPIAQYGGLTVLQVYLPLLIVMSLSLFGVIVLPIPLANYREQRILRRLATTPISPASLLGAQLIVVAAMALTAIGLMLGIGAGLFGLAMPRQSAGFAVTVLLGMAGLSSMGLWIAAVARSGRGAQIIGAGVFYPMQFLAGMWLPQQMMPSVLRDISEYSPLGALVNSIQSTVTGSFPSARELLVLAGYAAVFGCLSVRQFSWE